MATNRPQDVPPSKDTDTADTKPLAERPESKQGVITDEDTKNGRTFSVRIKNLRGECAGVKFDDNCTAKDVGAEQLNRLRGQFGKSVEVI